MTSNEAFDFLRSHQPMPNGDAVNNHLYKKLSEVMSYFQSYPDDNCLPLLLGVFGEGNGHGLYQRMDDILRVHSDEVVIKCLKKAIMNGTHFVRSWCFEFCCNYPDPELKSILIEASQSSNAEEREWALIGLTGQ